MRAAIARRDRVRVRVGRRGRIGHGDVVARRSIRIEGGVTTVVLGVRRRAAAAPNDGEE